MLKYVDSKVTFSEVPEEVSLCITLSGCPNRCNNCHSPELRESIGIALSDKRLKKLIEDNRGITCVCLLGGNGNEGWVLHTARYIKEYFPTLKVAWYSGNEGIHPCIGLNIHNFDYIKLGPYIEERGPLTSKTTNQKFFKVKLVPTNGDSYYLELEDITYKFWKDDKSDNR